MYRSFFLSLLITILLVRCTPAGPEKPGNIYQAQVKDSFQFVYNGNVDPSLAGIFYEKTDSSEYLSMLDARKKKIYLYAIDQDSHIARDSISLNHPVNVTGYKILSRDSLFALTRSREVIRFNFNGERLSSFYADSLPLLGSSFEAGSFYEYPFETDGVNFYFFIFPNDPLNSDEALEKYYSGNIEAIVKDSDPSVKKLAGRYPGKYLDHSYYVFSPARAMAAGYRMVYSFGSESELLVYDILKDTYQQKNAASSFFKDNKEFATEKLSDYNYIANYLTTNSRYGKIMYDHYRNCYYRVCLHPYHYNNEDGTVNKWIDKPWSVIRLDSSFTKVDEVVFPAGKYDPRNIMVSSKGLMVLRKEQYGTTNTLRYDLFDL